MFLKKFKNQLFLFLKERGYDLNDFSLQENENTVTLKYKSGEMCFDIRHQQENIQLFDCRFKIFNNNLPWSKWLPAQWVNFQIILQDFLVAWLENQLKLFIEEQREMDLWKEYKNGETFLNLEKIDFGDKSNFSLDERTQILLAVNDLKLLIHQQFETSEEEQKLVNDRLDYLVESSNRLNRFDWKSLAISTIISISLQLSLDTEKGQQLFNLFKQVFRIMPLLFGVDVHP